jgi:hypothetical protein
VKELTVLLATITVYGIYFYAGYDYIRAIKKESSPAIGTWGLFAVGTLLGVLSVFKATEVNIASNVLNVGDFLMCITILGFIFSKHPKITFDRFDTFFFSLAGCIVIFWIISKDAVWANYFSQALITLGYWPTIKKARNERKKNEPYKSWILFLISATVAIYPAWMNGNTLSLIYSIRTILVIPTMLFLIHKYSKTADAL